MSESLFEQYKAALRRGHMAALAGDLEDALAAYDAAARLVPERALPLASRGTVLHRLDRWPEAADSFERALNLAPDDEAALRARATARAERGLRSDAAADFERLAVVLDVAGRAGAAADAAGRAAELQSTPEDGASPDAGTTPDDPWSAALDQRRLDGLGATGLAGATASRWFAAGAAPARPARDGVPDQDAVAVPGHVAEGDADGSAAAAASGERGAAAVQGDGADVTDEPPEGGADGGAWPGIDLPSPPPPPIEGPPPDPEDLLREATLVLERGEVDAARDLMLTAARVHREAGRVDAALEISLNLLAIAPGDPGVHLAIANLQLDRGWTEVATEKIDLLVRLTSLTGDTQAEADVHGLASERLRDEPVPAAAGR